MQVPQPSDVRHRRRSSLRLPLVLAVVASLALLTASAWAEKAPDGVAVSPEVSRRVAEVTRSAMADVGGARVEVIPGQLDPRLRLAPCQQIEPFLPPGSPPWGRTQVGLRCTSGPVAWNVYLPVTVKVWRRVVVSTAALPAGAELAAANLQVAEVDVAGASGPTFTDTAGLAGRRLISAVAPGVPLRADNLRVRQWFAAGDKVTLFYKGEGFEASTDGQALNTGLDGQPVRVRVNSGQVITGMPTGENRVEVRS